MACLWPFLSRLLVVLDTMFKTKWHLFKINASIHHGKILKKLAAQEDLKMIFLPPYSPELAPVEIVFAVIKAKIRRSIGKTKCNFQKDEGKKTIIAALSEISKETVYKIWLRVIQVAKSFILSNTNALMTSAPYEN